MKTASFHPIYMLVALLFMLSSCMDIKPLQFERVEDIKINKVNGQSQLNFDLVGYNPNTKRFKVKDLQATITLDSLPIAEVHFDRIIKLKRETDFSFTASVSMSQGDLMRMMASGLTMFLNGEKMPLQVSGDFVLKKAVFRKRISFKLNQNIDPKTLKNFF